NAFGDFSKCTIVSELIRPDKMEDIVGQARDLWQNFVHQPQTARCLIVFLVLGEICKIIASNYDENLRALAPIISPDVSGAFAWHHSPVANACCRAAMRA